MSDDDDYCYGGGDGEGGGNDGGGVGGNGGVGDSGDGDPSKCFHFDDGSYSAVEEKRLCDFYQKELIDVTLVCEDSRGW